MATHTTKALYRCFISTAIQKLKELFEDAGDFEAVEEIHEIDLKLRQLCTKGVD